MKEITIEITTYCEFACDYCSTNASRKDYEHLPLEYILDFMVDNADAEVINISGGEPLAHPDIFKILKQARSLFDEVWLYTNMIENIRFNSDIIKKGIKCHANTVIREGEINIPPADKVHLLELKQHGKAEDMKQVNYTMSGRDCENCNHKVLQADREITKPCKKSYTEVN